MIGKSSLNGIAEKYPFRLEEQPNQRKAHACICCTSNNSDEHLGIADPSQHRVVDLTLAITWPHGVLVEEDSFMVAAQVHGGVRQM
jgi:hypothetical protein